MITRKNQHRSMPPLEEVLEHESRIKILKVVAIFDTPSFDQIVEQSSVRTRTVASNLDYLRNIGLIELKSRNGDEHHYVFNESNPHGVLLAKTLKLWITLEQHSESSSSACVT